MNKKDIQKSVWDRAFDDLDEEGNLIEQPRKIKTDQAVNVARANRIKSKNPEYSKTVSRGQLEYYSNPENKNYRANLNLKRSQDPVQEQRRISALREIMSTDEWKQKQINNGKIISEKYIADMDARKKALKAGWDKPGVREAKSISAKEAANRPEVREAALKHIHARAKKQMIPIVTREGIFHCAQAWADVVKKDKAMFGYWAKKFPTEYYQISQEEYIILTGKDPFN